jgi:tetratricopeptide (TPR) repeat protein
MNEYGYISNYFEGSLAAEERRQFDEKIQQDPAFAEEVAAFCSMMEAIKEQAVKEKKERFREMYKVAEKSSKTRVVFMLPWFRKAALVAAVILIIVTGWLLWPQPTASELADKYIKENFTTLRVTMGNTDSMQAATDLYNKGKWKEAGIVFERLAAADSSRTTAIKNAGIISLRLKEYDKALNYFGQLENKPGLEFNQGKFYHALVLLERDQAGDRQKARELLQKVSQEDSEEALAAKELMKHL